MLMSRKQVEARLGPIPPMDACDYLTCDCDAACKRETARRLMFGPRDIKDMHKPNRKDLGR